MSMTENLVAGEAFFAAIGLRKDTDWAVTRLSDGTPVAKCLTPEAFSRAANVLDSAVRVVTGGWWVPGVEDE